jgi:hypothetical protein
MGIREKMELVRRELDKSRYKVQGRSKITRADIMRYLVAAESGEWQEVHSSRLYNAYSRDYVRLAEAVAAAQEGWNNV